MNRSLKCKVCGKRIPHRSLEAGDDRCDDCIHRAGKLCTVCDLSVAFVKVSMTTMEGEVLDSQELCLDCWDHLRIKEVLHPGSKHIDKLR